MSTYRPGVVYEDGVALARRVWGRHVGVARLPDARGADGWRYVWVADLVRHELYVDPQGIWHMSTDDGAHAVFVPKGDMWHIVMDVPRHAAALVEPSRRREPRKRTHWR